MRTVVKMTVFGLVLAAGQAASADGGAAHKVKQTAPVKMGTSGGSANDASRLYCCGGTLGALVIRDGFTYILSNNHVLGRSGIANSGEDTVQPGLIDSNCSAANSNIVGDYQSDFVPLGTANVDTALSLARLANVDTSGAILDIGVPCSNTQNATIGLPVMKSGRTTGFTTGTVTSINTSVSIQYQKGCNTGKKFTVTFTNQIVTGAMSAGGDSGSVLYSNDGTPNPVGLLFAGSASQTIYNPIQAVVNAYTAGGHTFSFVGSNCAAARSSDPALLAAAAVKVPGEASMGKANQAKVEHENDLMKMPGVWGVGIGSSEKDATEAAIIVYVEHPGKGKSHNVPAELDGIKTRIVYTDPFVAQ